MGIKYAIIGSGSLGTANSEARSKVKDIDEIIASLLASVKKELGITMVSSYLLHGEYDWIMLFTAKNIVQAKKFAQIIMTKFPGRQDIHISQILFTVRENYIQNPNIMEMKNHL